MTPAHFLDARYGEALKGLLMREGTVEFITVFDHNRGVFSQARTTAAVTVFTKQRSRCHVTFYEAELNGKVEHTAISRIAPRHLLPGDSWRLHLPSRRETTNSRDDVRLGDIVRVRRGLATGSNAYFCLSEQGRRDAGIPKDYVRPVLASGRNLPIGSFTQEHWQQNLEAGHRVWLFWCRLPKTAIRNKRVRAYIDAGEAEGIHLRRTCRDSKTLPWYALEDVAAPDFIFTYMSKRRLRFVENLAGVRTLTALLGGWVQPGVDRSNASELLLSAGATAAFTAAAQDLGDGLRKIEPRRLSDVRLPALELSARAGDGRRRSLGKAAGSSGNEVAARARRRGARAVIACHLPTGAESPRRGR